MEDSVPFASREYVLFLGLLLFSRGMDFLSTWIATPTLELEANPLARRLGWKWGIPLNVVFCIGFALWPLPSIIICTTSVLVAARNFQVAWLMRTAGEEQYRDWLLQRLEDTPPALFVSCVVAQTVLVGLLGIILTAYSTQQLVPFGIGVGIVSYALAVGVFSLIAVWRRRRSTPMG